MNWLTEFVRPKIRTLFARRETPDNLWHKCPACEQMIFHRDLLANLKVCPHCSHHMRAGATERLAWTLDAGFTRIELPKALSDPLRFRDTKRYADRLKEAREKTHLDDAIVVAHGSIDGHRAVVAVMDFGFIGGSMGAAVGNGIVAAARLAALQEVPLIVFTASGGARMQEGAISLMQMPRTVIATRLVKDAGLPFIVVLTDPTTGGVTASFAMLGDFQIAEPGALIGFAGARVIEQTVRETLPEGFPERRVSAPARHPRHGGEAHRAEGDAGKADRPDAGEGNPPSGGVAPRQTQDSPPPLEGLGREADQGWGEGSSWRLASTPPPNPLPQGEGETMFLLRRRESPCHSFTRLPHDLVAHRRHRGAAARPASAADRSQPGSVAGPARQARPPRAPPAAGDPCRRHQRQGQHLRLPARHGGSRGAARARLHLAAPGALQRAHPPRRRAGVRYGAGATRWNRSSG